MKKIIILALFLVIPVLCLADFNISQWQYFKEINWPRYEDVSSLGNTNIGKISIDDEIFSGAQGNLRDVRIINSQNIEVPYKIVSGKQIESRVQMTNKLLNNSFIAGQSSSVVVDLGGQGKLINNATIITSSENFQRNVKIYGGNDMETWNTLRDDAYIYDFTDRKANFKSQNTTITFTDVAYRYLKIEIADPENAPVKINGINVSQKVSQKINEISRNLQFSASENGERRTTEIISDMGRSGIPVSKLNFSISGDNFNRAVYVYSSADKNDWKLLGQGSIFRYQTPKFNGENIVVSFSETNNQFLKIEIANKDDQPLALNGITAFSIYREIVFQAGNAGPYRIYYGNKKANFPQYDLDKYFQYLDVDSARPAVLSEQKINSAFVPEKEPEKPVSERIPYLFPTILVIASLILIFLVYRFLKK